MTRLVDAYTSAFARTAVVRRKLVLLLAILESSWPACTSVDSVVARSRGRFLVGAGLMMATFVVNAVITALLLTPLRVSCCAADWLKRPAEAEEITDL